MTRTRSLALAALSLALPLLSACAGGAGAAQMMTPVRIDMSGAVVASGTPGGGPFATFAPMDAAAWPAPSRTRGASGAPGPDYWQQRADYTIAATLDTASGGSVSGQVTIRYTNNSPDTLRFVWLQLDQNLYRAGSAGSAMNAPDSRWGVRGFRGGYELSDVRVDNRASTPKVDDTMMRLDLDAPLAPRGGRATIALRYRFAVPAHGSDRMGRDGTLFEIAQWYPRMAVYDDVRGWNTEPYLGQGEFYLEYGDIEYSVTAPAGYVIAGSGTLQNPHEVLSATQRARLGEAAKASSVVPIVTADEATARATPGTKTWRFRAESVRDVAWAGAPDFRWDATSWNGILCQAYYQFAKAKRAWESAAEQTCWSIRTYSTLFFPYPYPQATSVAGTVGGMEYPMFVMVHYGTEDPSSIFETIDHETGHNWFPMLVGSNERRYAWQDEGLNTLINAYSLERRYPGTSPWTRFVGDWRVTVDERTQSPLMTRPDHIDTRALGAMAYRKPAIALLALRNHVVGAASFDRAMREYARRWAFKHPTPGDFFRTIENVTGEDLAWFWRSFWYTTDVLDIAVDSVTARATEQGQVATLHLHRTTSIPFPVTARLRFADGSTRDVRFPVDLWARPTTGDRIAPSILVPDRVVGARLWPDGTVPDFEPRNDVWGNPPPVAPAPVTATP